jgi:uncharacterized protein YjbI with pentapeptide repeats
LPLYFIDSTFYGAISFVGAKFLGEAIFSTYRSSTSLDTHSAEFYGTANFYSVTFSKKVDFDGAKFLGEAIFRSTKFLSRVYFHSAKFYGVADFTSAEFSAEVDFSNIGIKDKMFFIYVFFEDGNKILFVTEDLSKVYFRYTDITKVRFGDRPRWGKENEFKVIEEVLLERFFEYREGLMIFRK